MDNQAVEHGYLLVATISTPGGFLGEIWQEGDERAVGAQPFRWVHCKVPRCGAEIRNLKPARTSHLRMHARAAARLANASGDAPETRHRAPVTQVDIARRLRLDVSSVNKILNGDVGPKFSDRTTARVHGLAAKLGYEHRPRGKKAKAEAARAVIVTAKNLIAAAEVVPDPWSKEIAPAIRMLETAIAAAREIWPAPADVRNARVWPARAEVAHG